MRTLKNPPVIRLLTCLVAASALLLGTLQSKAITLDFANIGGAAISFNGSSQFSFTPASPADQFEITSLGSAFGDLGNVSGTFTIGDVATFGGIQTAPVTGSGTLTIHGGGLDLIGTVDWKDITSLGTGDTLNLNGLVNLTGITYTGTQADLLALAAAGSAIDVVTFQFTPAKTVTELKSTAISSSFSGKITSATVPDGGSTIMLLGFVLSGFGYIGRKFRN